MVALGKLRKKVPMDVHLKFKRNIIIKNNATYQ